MKFTQEIKDKWLARLRDPNSKQARKTGFLRPAGEQVTQDSTAPMCCLGHLQYVMRGYCAKYEGTFITSYDDDSDKLFGWDITNYLMTLNDGKEFTLPQIADYIETHIPAVKE